MNIELTPGGRRILEGTIALFQDPAKHTTGTFARDKNGAPVSASDRDAVCFCFIGGMDRAATSSGASSADHDVATEAVVQTIERKYGIFPTRASINDGHDDCVFDELGALLSGREAVIRVCEITLTAPEHGYVG